MYRVAVKHLWQCEQGLALQCDHTWLSGSIWGGSPPFLCGRKKPFNTWIYHYASCLIFGWALLQHPQRPANQFYALCTVYQRSDPSHQHASSNPDMPGGTFLPFIGFISHIHLGKSLRKIEEWRPIQEKKQTFHLSHSKQGQFDFLLPV